MQIMPKKEQAPASNANTAGAPHTILGPEANFDGRLVFEGQVRIDGKFSGEIETKDSVVIGKTAEVSATLNVGSLVLHGTLRGDVHASSTIELHPPARLYGDINSPTLIINKGVIFEGNCRMESSPENDKAPKLRHSKDKNGEAQRVAAE